MIKIQEAVKKIPREILEEMAIVDISSRRWELRHILMSISTDTRRGEEGKEELGMGISTFEKERKYFTELDLWDPKYDEDYAQAIKGQYCEFKGEY